MIEEELTSWLQANIALVANRVYPMKLPQNPTLPAITYQKISGLRVQSHDGPSGLAYPRFQVSCWGESYSDAKQVAEEVRQDLDGYQGLMGVVQVGAALLQNEIDFYIPETGYYHVPVDFIIWHDET